MNMEAARGYYDLRCGYVREVRHGRRPSRFSSDDSGLETNKDS